MRKTAANPSTTSTSLATWAVASVLGVCTAFAAADVEAAEAWELSPVRIRVLLDVEAPVGVQTWLASRLLASLPDRCAISAGPVWKIEFGDARSQSETPRTPTPSPSPEDGGGGFRVRDAAGAPGGAEAEFTGKSPAADLDRSIETFRSALDEPQPDSPPETFGADWAEFDKLLAVHVDQTRGTSRIRAREFDVATRRWGPIVTRETRQRGNVERVAFDALRAAVSPIVRFRLDPDNRNYVLLSVKGQGITAASGDFYQIAPGDVLIPILRRNDHEGRPREGGIRQVPWTFFVVNSPGDGLHLIPIQTACFSSAYLLVDSFGDERLRGAVYSGTRRPLGVRRRGRIEQFALAARSAGAATTLRLVTWGPTSQPMAGCRIYERESGDAFRLIGVSDRDGSVRIERTDAVIRMLWIKSGNQLLAKLPVIPGITPVEDVPLPDDDTRLEIEGELTALRDELIDVVALRKVLIARFRARLEAGDVDAARRLVDRLKELPTRAQFSQRIDRQERTAKSNDPKTQARIERLFADTKVMLSKYLDGREISQLYGLLGEAADEATDDGA